ncbi:MAG: hypothetical protein H7333_08180 [Bdellovibrionales bacterium]|nr:hypothetical protein [Oligoflexia bacterium]
MSFDYKKVKSRSEDSHGNSWAAYSDLFMMLSTVFLLLYVSVGLRSQTSGVEVFQKVKTLQAQNADLQQQLEVYNTLRDNQLKTDSSEKEKEVYQKLMGKLDLLKSEAKDEKEKLTQQAKENETKEYALNEYQRLIRNIINTNVLSKTQLQHRDVIISKKDTINQVQKETINDQTQQITALNQDITEKQGEIAQTREKIKLANAEVQRKISLLRKKERDSQISQSQMNKRIAELKSNSHKLLQGLESKRQAALNELNQVQSNLAKAQKDIEVKGTELASTKAESEHIKAEAATLKIDHDLQMVSLKNQFASREGKLKADFEGALGRERLSAAEKARRLGEFAAAAKAREGDLAKQLGSLGQQVKSAQDRASQAEVEKGRAVASAEGLAKTNANLSADLKRAQELANARSELAKRIKGELARAGLKGTVDGKTGDVTLSFGEEYFDTGSSDLKPQMRDTLKKFMPGYSKSLFSDQKIAKNIDNVEIIGFASSTYRGRYVPPDSLNPSDREAINYNLKLSFNRADSIFRHIFDTNKMSFEHQRDLLPKIKVVGRGYLPEGKTSGEIPAGIDEKTFCAKYNCKQAQKVIIKFKLKD